MRAIRDLLPATGLVFALALLAGCFTPQERPAQLQAVARWQDQRLAPADSMRTFLAGADAHVRLAAVRAAGLIARNDVVTEVLAVLQDPSPTVAAEAAWALGLMGDPQALPALDQAAADPRPEVRDAALAALGQLPNDGTALLAAAAHDDPLTAERAWDGLRNRASEVAPAALRQAITDGLARPEANVRWRVLRCAEMVVDSTLVPELAPFALSAQIPVMVHAQRALSHQASGAALGAALGGAEKVGRFHGREQDQARIASCRALGALGGLGLRGGNPDEALANRLAAFLITSAGQASPHVAETALTAMARLIRDLPLPAEAAAQESLMPVWRIRLARSARDQLARQQIGVRAAAVTALGAVRGAGSAAELEGLLAQETATPVLAATLAAIAAVHPRPVPILTAWTGPKSPVPGHADLPLGAVVRTAALTGLNDVRRQRPAAAAAGDDHRIAGHLLTAANDDDYVVSSTAAELLGSLPGDESLLALTTLWDRAAGPGRADIRSGVLAGLEALCAAPGDTAAGSWHPSEVLRQEARRVLRESFDAPDLRLRNAGRRAALASGLLPPELVPTAASLLATLPAVQRDPRQPPVTTAFDAPKLRCVSDRGEFVISLDGELAPNTCALFAALVEQGYFADLTFHRVVPDFVVQGGDPDGHGSGGPGFTIRSEWSRRPYERGTVGIAHAGKDTGGSQFFIALSPQPHLNGRYTIIGKVSSGMASVDKIQIGDRFRLELVP